MDNCSRTGDNKGRALRYAAIWMLFGLVGAWIELLSSAQLPLRERMLEDLFKHNGAIGYTGHKEKEQGNRVPRPDIDMQLLTVNDYSRPGTKTDGIENIVIHYLGNPGTTAQENRDYFESLKDLRNTYMSANYIVGLEGEIIQCVPDDEVAYASNGKNSTSISIENCHQDRSGIFTEETYNSLVRLTAYLADKYGLGRDDIIRHHDVTGKDCPAYFVEHEDKWEAFKDDVMEYRERFTKKRTAAPGLYIDAIRSIRDV